MNYINSYFNSVATFENSESIFCMITITKVFLLANKSLINRDISKHVKLQQYAPLMTMLRWL